MREYNNNNDQGDCMNYLTTSEMATIWNISRRRIATLCKDGRIPGCILKGKMWLIPESAVKPDDARHEVKGTVTKIQSSRTGYTTT